MENGTPIGLSPTVFRPVKPIAPLPTPTPITAIPVTVQAPTAASPGANPSGKGGVPLQLLSINVVQSPNIEQSYTNSEVSVSFARNTSDVDYASVNIWFVGYHGSTNPTLMANGTKSPITFLCDSTGETVTVYAQTVGTTGLTAPLSFALQSSVTLNGVIGAPPEPTITQYTIATPTGYQFAFQQIVLSPGDEDVIASYNIYKGGVNNSALATVVHVFKHDPTNSGNVIVFQDAVQRGQIFYYWVSAVNTKGLESALESATSGSGVSTYSPAVSSTNVVNSRTTVSTGLSSPETTPTSSWTAGNNAYIPGYVTFEAIITKPGVDCLLDVLLWASNDIHGNPQGYMFRFDNRAGEYPAQIYKFTGGSSYSTYNAHGTTNSSRLPVGTYTCFVDWNPTGYMNMFVNGIWVMSMTDTTYVPSGAVYYGYETNSLAIAPYIVNCSLFSSGELLSQGSIAAISQTTFTYASTSSSITWTWSAFDIYNPDGTTILVPANSSGTAFTGLTSSTNYYFAFVVAMSTGICTVTNEGTSPASTQTITQTYNGDGNLGINWDVEIPTTSSGSGGGSGGGGGGGGGGHCFTLSTPLLNGTRIGDVRVGDWVWVELDNGKTTLRQVKEVIDTEYSGPMQDMGEGHYVKANHLFKQGKTWVRADAIFPKKVQFMGTVRNLHINTNKEEERNYILWNDMVAHNNKTYQ
jgi:hypothetical protein